MTLPVTYCAMEASTVDSSSKKHVPGINVHRSVRKTLVRFRRDAEKFVFFYNKEAINTFLTVLVNLHFIKYHQQTPAKAAIVFTLMVVTNSPRSLQ